MDSFLNFSEPFSGDPNQLESHSSEKYCMDLDKPNAKTRYRPCWDLAGISHEEEALIKKWQQQTNQKELYSHGQMNQDKKYWYVPDDELLIHNDVYSKFVSRGINQYTIEKPKPIFALFIDFDFKQLKGIIPQAIEVFTKIVAETIQSFWPKCEKFRYIVNCSTYTKCTLKNDNDIEFAGQKTGIHFHMPDVHVTLERMLEIRESLLAKLIETYGHRKKPMNDWKDVIDTSVYDPLRGLRMVGSLKCSNCDVCKNDKKKKQACTNCHSRGFVNDDFNGRPYWLFLASNGISRDIEKEKEYLLDFKKLVNDCSIRIATNEATEPFEIPHGAPRYTPEETQKRSRKISSRAKNVTHDDIRCQLVQDSIREHYLYSSIVVTDLRETSTGYLVHVSGTNSHWCQNVNREHRSNRIYFRIDPTGIRQRCHDNAETMSSEMRFGLCKDYESAPITLRPSVLSILFPKDDDSGISLVQATTNHQTTADELKRLVALGDRLCKKLYGTSWSSTLLFQNNSTFLKTKKDYTVIFPDHIGSKYVDVMKLNGHATLVEDCETMMNIEHKELKLPGITSFLQLEETVFEEFNEILDYMCYTEKLPNSAKNTTDILS